MSDETDVIEVDNSKKFRKKNDLQKMLKRLDKSTEDAIEFLEKTFKDTGIDTKIRVDAAKYLLDKRVELSDSINKDQFARLVAEAKDELAHEALARAGRGMKVIPNQNSDDDDDDSDAPLYKPDMIVDISHVNRVK